MNRPDNDVLSALAQLETAPQFETIMKWVENSLHDRDVANRTAKGEVLLNGQGKAQELAEFINHARTARQVLSKANSKKT